MSDFIIFGAGHKNYILDLKMMLKDKSAFSTDYTALLLESEKIKNDLFIFEHDLWEY